MRVVSPVYAQGLLVMPDDDTTEFDRNELRELFRDATGDAVDESNFATREDVEKYLDKQLSKAEAEEAPDDDEEAEFVVSDEGNVLDRMEEQGVPQDLIDACAEYVEESRREGVEKSLGVENADEYLADSLDKNAALLAEQVQKAEERQEALVEAVAEGEPEAPVLDSVIYDEEGM